MNDVNLEILWPYELTDQNVFEMSCKGWVHISVKIDEVKSFEVFLYDPVRATQDLTEAASRGQPWILEPNLILVTEVTPVIVAQALDEAWSSGFFDGFLKTSI